MSRPLRIEYPGALYHVMNRGGEARKTFFDKSDYQLFLDLLQEAFDRWEAEILAYCLLPNHYHVCLRTPLGNLSRIMRHVDGLYTQRFNRAHHRDGTLFRGRYKAILVDGDSYLTSVVRYIHLNPVVAGLSKTPQAYRWSSHSAYLKKKAPIWLSTKPVLGYFPHRESFHRFVLSGNEPNMERFYRMGRQAPVLGSETFLEGLKRKMPGMGKEHPRYERKTFRPSFDQVIRAVSGEYEKPANEIMSGRRGQGNEARKVAMFLVSRMCELTLQQAAGKFNVSSYGVVGWNCHGVLARMNSERKFKKRIEGLKERIIQQKI
ncbi:MAG TPA: transposase [Nitrospiria bacterium]